MTKKLMIIRSELGWNKIPDSTEVTLMNMPKTDAHFLNKHYLLRGKFIKSKRFLTFNTTKALGPYKKGEMLGFGIGIKIQYELET